MRSAEATNLSIVNLATISSDVVGYLALGSRLQLSILEALELELYGRVRAEASVV